MPFSVFALPPPLVLSTMDDLLDLDWGKKPTSSNGSSAGASLSNNGSSYNFDALTRSLPQSQPASSQNRGTMGTFATTASTSKKALPTSNPSEEDAFSSLLGFQSRTSSASSTTISMAESLKREQQQKMGIAIPSNTPKQSSIPSDSAWEGLDSFLSGPKSRATAPIK